MQVYIKTLTKITTGRNFFNLIKACMKNPELTSYSVVENWNFPTKVRNKAKIYTLVTYIQPCAGGSNRGDQARKIYGRHQIGKEKVSLLIDAVILRI